MRALEIGLIASAQTTSGSDRYYFSLLRSLEQCDVRVRGVVLGDPSAVDGALPGITSFAPEGSRARRRWLGLRAAVSPLVESSDLVASHFAPHAFPVLDRIRKRPLVVHFHGPWALEGRAAGVKRATLLLRSMQEKAVYRRARRLIVLSRAFADVLATEYGIDEARIRVIPGGVDTARFNESVDRRNARCRLGWPTDRRIVLTVRRLAPTKGLPALLTALDTVRRNVPDVLLVIAGAGPLRADLEAQVAGLGLERWVRFTGFVPDADLPMLYRAADLSIVPTEAFEGFGLVVVESLACGTPALVTPVTGLPEVVDGLDRALVMPGSDAASIAGSAIDALRGNARLPSSDSCRRHAEAFDWKTIAHRVRDVYAEAL